MKQVRIYDSFETLPASYHHLFDDHLASSIFLTGTWFTNLIRNACSDNQLLQIYSLESPCLDGKPNVLLPMFVYEHSSRWRPRQLVSAANFYSCVFAPLIDSSRPLASDDLARFFDLLAKGPKKFDTIDLHPLDRDGDVFERLLEAFSLAGVATQPYFCFGNWYLEVRGRSFEEYFNGIPSALRNTIRRKAKQLKRTRALKIEIVTGSADVERAIAAYEQVYAASWKVPEPFPTFVPELIRRCAEKGWLRLGLASIAGQPAAAQLWFVHRGVASIYKLAYDEQYAKTSVGSLLTAELMRYVIDEDKVAEVDFLGGDEPYKRDWMSHRRERWGIAAFNLRTIPGWVLACRHIGAAKIKRLFCRGATSRQ